ncbi:phytoene desaturase family protein [uncultured Jatrophihabitans sp.]|uniref:phytoene desaturase family protein n=1 Tax=uncultured Jatrophihabitans sp. TaxID=1610747 RepID=UPI0035CA9D8B
MTVDAVVVGAGHNGLVAANLLADAGWDVVVCEAADTPGGAVASAEVTAPGFRTDLFSAFYPLAVASPVLNALDLGSYGVSWARAPAVLAHLLPDGRSATLWQDPAQTAASLAKFGAADGEAWLRITAQWDRIGDAVVQALLSPFPPVAAVGRLLRRLGVDELLRLARMAAQPVRRFGEENFAGPGGPILFAGNALHADLPPDGAGSALYGWLLAMLGHSYGFPVPVGGADVLIKGLVRRLEAKGGQLRLSARVDKIVVSSGAARAVVLQSGERIDARRAVLADVAAPALFDKLVGIDDLPRRFVADLRHFQWDAPTVKIDWAVGAPVPWTDPDARKAGTVHLGVDMDGLTDYAADLSTRRIPRAPFVLFGQMTTADPTRSPAGTESAWAYTHLPRGVDFTADDIARHVEKVEAVVEAHAPGFRAAVLARHVQAPADLQRRDANLVDGAINGGTAQLHQQLVFRPVPGLGNAVTPVDRLYLAGSSAHPGGGVHGAPGANAAHAALARERVTGGARHAFQAALLRRIYRDGALAGLDSQDSSANR